MMYQSTGEVRLPKKGEFYLQGRAEQYAHEEPLMPYDIIPRGVRIAWTDFAMQKRIIMEPVCS